MIAEALRWTLTIRYCANDPRPLPCLSRKAAHDEGLGDPIGGKEMHHLMRFQRRWSLTVVSLVLRMGLERFHQDLIGQERCWRSN